MTNQAGGPESRSRLARIVSPADDSTRSDLVIGLVVQVIILVIFVNQARQSSTSTSARVLELFVAVVFAAGSIRSAWLIRQQVKSTRS